MSIYQAIKSDHLKLKSLLNDLVELEKDDEFRMTLIEDLGKQLIPHIRAEESIFYNTLRGVNADKKLLFHAFQEHIEIEGLFRSLQVLDKFKLNWLPTAKKLQNIVFRHIQNEEFELFTEAQNAFTEDESQLLEASFQELKLKIEHDGIFKNSFEMVFNMLPPKISSKMANFVKKDELRP
jgi:hypothetical protein